MSSRGVDGGVGGVGGVDDELAGLLSAAVNRVSGENVSNTPDFILGGFLRTVLAAADKAINDRDRWYGVALEPGGGSRSLPPAAVFLVAVDDKHFGGRVWLFSTARAAEEAAWKWARQRAANVDSIAVEGNRRTRLRLTYRDGDCVWVEERAVDAPVVV